MTEQEFFDVTAAMKLLGVTPEDLRSMAARKTAHVAELEQFLEARNRAREEVKRDS